MRGYTYMRRDVPSCTGIRADSGFPEQEREPIRIAGNRAPADLETQFVIGTVMQIGVADEFEALVEHFPDDEHRVDTAPVLGGLWFFSTWASTRCCEGRRRCVFRAKPAISPTENVLCVRWLTLRAWPHESTRSLVLSSLCT